LSDPLVSELIVDYLLRLQFLTSGRKILLFTEEPVGGAHDVDLVNRLTRASVEWRPLEYNVGGLQWVQKIALGLIMLWRTWRFSDGYQNTWLVGFLSFGGNYAALLSKFGLGRNVTVCFEPHSKYMVEMGVWKVNGIRHRIVRWLEKLQLQGAYALVLPTKAGMALARGINAKGQLIYQGITIDVRKAGFEPASRSAFREQFGWRDNIVLAYVGKFGGIYYSVAEYMGFLLKIHAAGPEFRFLIIASQIQLDQVRADPGYHLLSSVITLYPPVAPIALHCILSAADLGVIAVPPTPSQAYRTPVKTAHYWAAGLPIIIPEGVSDDHEIARSEQVGLVVTDLSTINGHQFVAEVMELFTDGAEPVRARCIEVAMKYRDTGKMVELLDRLLT